MRLKGSSPGSPEGAVYGGLPGRAASIEAGSTTTGLPGSAASVVNSGSTNAAVLDFTIPRGDVGPQGAPGTPGSVTITGLGDSTTIGRLVCATALGGNATADTVNTWAKIATFSLTSQNTSLTFLLAAAASGKQLGMGDDTAVVSLYFSTNLTNANPNVSLNMVSKGGTGSMILADSFKVISNAWNIGELWVRKGTSFGRLAFWEIAVSSSAGSITYHTTPPWQAAEPTGSMVNVSTNGVTAFGIPVVTTTAAQTLTNKTLTAPTVSNPVVKDSLGNTVSTVLNRASAVNYIQFRAEATGGSPALFCEGTDTNIGWTICPKGTGAVGIYQTTGDTARFAAIGALANVNLNLESKGTGVVQANGNPVGVRVAVPATATSTGVVGQWSADASWHYVCTATNTWRRVALATW